MTGLAASTTGNAGNVNATPIAITPFDATRVMTAYNDGRIYSSPEGTNLGGAGSTMLVHGPSSSTVHAMIPHSTEVLTVFAD